MNTIGQRIKHYRKNKQFTLKELSSNCNASQAFLSQVENNDSSPSIHMLESIATALGVPLFSLLSDEKQLTEDFTWYYNLRSEVQDMLKSDPEKSKTALELVYIILKYDVPFSFIEDMLTSYFRLKNYLLTSFKKDTQKKNTPYTDVDVDVDINFIKGEVTIKGR